VYTILLTTRCASGSASLPDPTTLETEAQKLEREQNVRDVLEALGEYKCDAGMSVETVPAVVNIKTLKGNLLLLQKSSPLRGRWVWRRVSKRKKSVSGQFAVKYESETYCWA
jgi:hypothetical protein